jgi:hypothetical protein
LWGYIPDEIDLCFIDMAVGKMLQQVSPGKDVEFFFKQVAALRADAFEVFDGVGEYGWGGADEILFTTNLTEN